MFLLHLIKGTLTEGEGLLVLTSYNLLLLIFKTLFTLYKTGHLNEVSCSDPSPSVSFLWLNHIFCRSVQGFKASKVTDAVADVTSV
jgi:hypothetical protein